MPMPDPPVLLVVGAGASSSWREGLRRLAALHPLVLLESGPAAWACPYVLDTVDADLRDGPAVAAAVDAVAARHFVTGVMTYLEEHAPLAAHLAACRGLPGLGAPAAAACRDKAVMRSQLAARDVPQARSYPVPDAPTAVEYARLLGYPVVLKPRGPSQALRLRSARTATQVHDAFRAAQEASLPRADAVTGVLIEEWIAGPAVAVECVVRPDGVRLVAVTRNGPAAGGDATVPVPDVRATAVRALQALGVEYGIMRVEMRLTPHGPTVTEIAARPSADFLPVLARLATGAVGADAAGGPAEGTAARIGRRSTPLSAVTGEDR
ncbi:acetyl-CoA carboxylase biotin carboxylase subunit family protein [Streptomyces sp. NPDC059788]|uniref:ATP-grasp domain-containing protein n=1 Tax=Streptomyces sp. NPDC059788 TaxID=3346948 RepID=UPI00364D7E61